MKCFALFFFIFLEAASGAAVIPVKSQGQIFLGANFYEARAQFGEDRKDRPFSSNGKFTKQELTYFGIFSLEDKIALIATGAIVNSLEFKNDDNTSSFTGAGDNAFGGRYLISKDSTGAKSLQALVSFPFYSARANPAPGNRQEDIDLRYLQDFYQTLGLDFVTGEFAFRKRFLAPSDQLRFDLGAGRAWNKFLFMGHLHGIRGLSNQTGNSRNTNPNVSTDFDLLKIGPSLAYRYQKDEAIQLGYLKDLWGRNIGRGSAIFVTWWKDFGR